jgi:hypothetical protein
MSGISTLTNSQFLIFNSKVGVILRGSCLSLSFIGNKGFPFNVYLKNSTLNVLAIKTTLFAPLTRRQKDFNGRTSFFAQWRKK